MTLANKITLTRFLLIPVMVVFMMLDTTKEIMGVQMYHFIAAIIFTIASFTDFLDGYIARKYNQITTFGKFLDPIADKVLVISAMIFLVGTGTIAFWGVVIVIFREFIITGVRLLAMEKGDVIAASPYGKIKTITTMLALLIMLFGNFTLQPIYGEVLWYIAIFFTVVSGLDYIIKNRKIIFSNI